MFTAWNGQYICACMCVYIYIYIYIILVYLRIVCRVLASILGQCVRDVWWTKWHWDSFYSDYSCFPLSVSFLSCSTLFFFCVLLLLEVQTRKAWESLGIGEHCVADKVHIDFLASSVCCGGCVSASDWVPAK